MERIRIWKGAMGDKGLRASMTKTKCMISGVGLDMLKNRGKYSLSQGCGMQFHPLQAAYVLGP